MTSTNNMLTAELAESLSKVGGMMTITATMTPSFVDWALKHNTHNRAIRPSVVKSYAEQMRQGLWTLTHEGIAFMKSGALADGQHRLEAIKAAGYPAIQMNVTFGLEEGSILNINTGVPRPPRDGIMLATGLNMNSQHAATMVWLVTLEKGDHYTGVKMNRSMLMRAAEKYYDSVVAIEGAAIVRGLSATFYAPLVWLYYHGENPQTVRDFIEGVKTGEGLVKGDPRLRYRNDYMAGKLGRKCQVGDSARATAFAAVTQLYFIFANGGRADRLTPWTFAHAIDALRDRANRLSLAKSATEAQH